MYDNKETWIKIKPATYEKAQRVEASLKASALRQGLHMAVGNSTTMFYATPDVPIGKVKITMPRVYKGIPEFIKMLDDPEDDWCPREDEHSSGTVCSWC